MKKLLSVSILVGLVSLFAFKSKEVNLKSDDPKGIQFHTGSWDEALELAVKEDKLIFLDISASWCGPCKKIKRETFSSAEVGDYYNQNFINVAVDGEKGEGPMLAKKYHIKGYPSLLFINSQGELVDGTAGFRKSKDFIKIGTKANAKKQ